MNVQLLCIAGLLFCLTSCNTNVKKQQDLPIDKQATTETVSLYNNLKKIMDKGILFGHQDDLAYGHAWYNEPNRSDVKDVCGDYPALAGWELGHVEIGAEYNLDSIYFTNMRRYVLEAYERGMINSFSWHGDNIITGNTAWDCAQDNVVKSVLTGGENHQQYSEWLDRVAGFFADLKDKDGKPIPVIFRMYHEHTGDWFWWCRKQCTPEEYIALWKMTVEYLRDTRNIHHLLYAYSTAEVDNEAAFLERYPGDDCVDIIGFDSYAPGSDSAAIAHYTKRMELNLDIVTTYAAQSNKIPTVGETGMESVADSSYFTQVLYPVISKYKIASVLLWRNAWEKGKPKHYYAPFQGHPASEDFIAFKNKPNILFAKDLPDMYECSEQ